MRRHIFLIILIAMFAGLSMRTSAQEVAIKTNLLSDALLNPNVGVEVGLAPQWTLELEGELNAWTIGDNHRWKHWSLQPEARYWICDRFGGHFFGIHAHGGQYNIGGINFGLNFLGTDFGKLKNSRYQGWFVGGGISYGYDWVINRHWNFEAEIGIGYSYTRYDQFQCEGCGKKIATDRPHNYYGITRLALSIVYLF